MHIHISPAVTEDVAELAKVYMGSFRSSHWMLALYPGVYHGDAQAIEFLDWLTRTRLDNAMSDPNKRVMKAVDTGSPDPKIVGLCLWIGPQDWAAWDAKDNKDVERHISKAPTSIDHETLSNYYRLMKVKVTRHMSGKRFWCRYHPSLGLLCHC